MTPLQLIEPETQLNSPDDNAPLAENGPQPTKSWLRRLWGGTLVVVGYLLSPLCWWNDLVINLPLALGFGYLFSRPWPDALVPMTGVGYWLTNVIGFVLMQQGAATALQKDRQGSKSRSLRNGLITSTVYTVAIVVLIQVHILEMPDFLSGDLFATLHTVLPNWLTDWISV
ncbi:MAG TPA: hypothetical protein V6D20_19765 [Candidatus Obscuribacterales bacterium]